MCGGPLFSFALPVLGAGPKPGLGSDLESCKTSVGHPASSGLLTSSPA